MTFARAVISRPRLLIASYPSRGLDIATVHAVHKTLFRLKKQGVGTILISEDLGAVHDVRPDPGPVFSHCVWTVLCRRVYAE